MRFGACCYFAYLDGRQFLPVRVRLVSGCDEVLLRMKTIGELNITVGFGEREFHIGKGEWEFKTRNEKNHWV